MLQIFARVGSACCDVAKSACDSVVSVVQVAGRSAVAVAKGAALGVGVFIGGASLAVPVMAQAPPTVEMPDLGIDASDLITGLTAEYAAFVGPIFGLGLAITMLWMIYRRSRTTVKGG